MSGVTGASGVSEADGLRGLDLDLRVKELVADLLADQSGGLGPSVYETARLVALVPWLAGHRERVRYLLNEQDGGGSWGGPDGYAIVPTLSATEALLTELARADGQAELPAELAAAAERGLAAARRLIARAAETGVPNTIVSMLVVPALVADINAHAAGPELELPAGLDGERLRQLRDGGWRNPLVGHYLEIVGPVAVRADEMQPVDGVIGCSVAATAAWLGAGKPAEDDACVRFLDRTQARGAGPVPAMTSIVHYERAWILGNLADAGVALPLLTPLAADLPRDTARVGAPTAPGFAHEAETSAIILSALAKLGPAAEPEYLWQYDAGTHFLSTIPEFTASTSTNAHLVQALGCYLEQGPADGERYADAIARIAGWLRERQQADGSWLDKWHASPYFATMRCALALHRYAGPEHAPTVRQAVDGILDRQRPDGSWGQWGGTAEETAYAVQTLLRVRPDDAEAVAAALRGCRFLLEHGLGRDHAHTALWIGKELYAPTYIVRAAVLGALALAQQHQQ